MHSFYTTIDRLIGEDNLRTNMSILNALNWMVAIGCNQFWMIYVWSRINVHNIRAFTHNKRDIRSVRCIKITLFKTSNQQSYMFRTQWTHTRSHISIFVSVMHHTLAFAILFIFSRACTHTHTQYTRTHAHRTFKHAGRDGTCIVLHCRWGEDTENMPLLRIYDDESWRLKFLSIKCLICGGDSSNIRLTHRQIIIINHASKSFQKWNTTKWHVRTFSMKYRNDHPRPIASSSTNYFASLYDIKSLSIYSYILLFFLDSHSHFIFPFTFSFVTIFQL